MDTNKVIDFVNNTTLDEKVYFIHLISRSIYIPTPKYNDDGKASCEVYVQNIELDSEIPAVPHGTAIQLNTKDLRDYEGVDE